MLQGERIYLVMTQPFATNQPHSHTRGTAEIWVKVSPGTGLSLLGSELREIPRNAAYLVPPTGTIDHSQHQPQQDRSRVVALYRAEARREEAVEEEAAAI